MSSVYIDDDQPAALRQRRVDPGKTYTKPSASTSTSSNTIVSQKPTGLNRLGRIDKGRHRSGFEIPRKIFHSSIGFLVLYLYTHGYGVDGVLNSLGVYLIVLIVTETLRFYSSTFEHAYETVMGIFMREDERDRVNGVVYYVVGVMLCFLFLPTDIACVAVVILSWCDTTASVMGRLFGKYTPKLPFGGVIFGRKKSIAGTLSAIAMGCLIGYFFWSKWGPEGDVGRGQLSWVPGRQHPYVPEKYFLSYNLKLPNPNSHMSFKNLVLVTGLVAGFSEAVDIYGVDDNFTLPVFSGFLLYLIMYINK